MSFFRKNKFWGGLVLGVAFVLFLTPMVAQAGLSVLNPANWPLLLLQLISTLFGLIGGLLVTLAGVLVNWMLGLNSQVMDSSNTLLYTGWRIARDFANLGFVLFTVVIAFMIILRYKEYGSQKLLFNLIKAAILVNFSLAIAGVFVDFSDIATNFFVSRIGNGFDMAKSITAAFNPQRLYMENDVANSLDARPPDDVGGATKVSVAVVSSIAEFVFVIAFSLITAITMLGLAFMLLLRFVWLSLLLMVSPLVYLAWVIPSLGKHWDTWWKKFFQWTFFGPAVMFFVYVALVAAQSLGKTPAEISSSGNYFTSSLNGIMTQGSQMIILCAVMLGGLMAAQKIGVTGADTALKAAKGVGTGVKKWGGNKAMRWGVNPIRKIGSNAGERILNPITSKLESFAIKAPPGSRREKFWTNRHKKAENARNNLATAAAEPWMNRTQSVSLIGSMLNGARNESGLFGRGKKKVKHWECGFDGVTITSARNPNTLGRTCPDFSKYPGHPPTKWNELAS